MAKKAGRRISRCFKASIRGLIKARDFYLNSMSECGAGMEYGAVLGCPTAQISTLPRSFSVNYSTTKSTKNEDLRELKRAASSGSSLSNKVVEPEIDRQGQMRQPLVAGRRSQGMGIGRIDEDEPCEFGEDDDVKIKTEHLYPRSRSYAVLKRVN